MEDLIKNTLNQLESARLLKTLYNDNNQIFFCDYINYLEESTNIYSGILDKGYSLFLKIEVSFSIPFFI